MMYFSIISTLVALSFFINKNNLVILAQEEHLELIKQGSDVITGITTYLKALSSKKKHAPFNIMQLNENYLESSGTKNVFSPNIFKKVPKQTADEMWGKIMNENKIFSIKKDTLIIPGQLGILLLMVFQQTMCEAVTLYKQLENYSKEDRAKYFRFLQKLHDDSFQLIPENINFLRIVMPTLCLKRTLFALSDEDQLKLLSIIKQSKSNLEVNFVFADCFDLRLQKIIREFTWTIRASSSSCSQILTRDLLFSFDFIDKFKNEREEKLSLIERLLASAFTYRSVLKEKLEKEAEKKLPYLQIPKDMVSHQDNAHQYSGTADKSSKADEKIFYKANSQELKERKNIFNKFFRRMLKNGSNKRTSKEKKWKDKNRRLPSETSQGVDPYETDTSITSLSESDSEGFSYENDHSKYANIISTNALENTQTPAPSSAPESPVSVKTPNSVYTTQLPESMGRTERIKKLSPVSKHHEKLIQELKQKFSQRRAS